MNILEKIIADKKIEVAERKVSVPEEILRETDAYNRKCISMKDALLRHNTTGIIAEFKRRSPSKGWFHQTIDVNDVIPVYEEAGAAAVSILTDEKYFGGKKQDLLQIREGIRIPILRKDFIVDEYQLLEAKAWGADVILLIAAALTTTQVETLALKAKELGLEVLLEVHNEEELAHDCKAVDMIGVNNRNLETFAVSVQTSFDLVTKIPAGKIPIAESGITSVETILSLKSAGFKGFLVGEAFMKEAQPAIAFAEFITRLKAMQ